MSKRKKPVKAAGKKSKAANKSIVVVERPSRRGKLTPAQKKKQLDALEGNRWFELRAKHGRDKLFNSPKDLMSSALEYFKWCDDNPEKKSELVKYEGGASEYKVSLKRPYTMQDLCRYLHCNTAYFRQFKGALRAKDKSLWTTQDEDFSTVIHCIEEIVQSQQISGAMTGHFNGNIVSRLLGLVDKHDVKSDDAPIQAPVFNVYTSGPPLAGSEEEVKD